MTSDERSGSRTAERRNPPIRSSSCTATALPSMVDTPPGIGLFRPVSFIRSPSFRAMTPARGNFSRSCWTNEPSSREPSARSTYKRWRPTCITRTTTRACTILDYPEVSTQTLPTTPEVWHGTSGAFSSGLANWQPAGTPPDAPTDLTTMLGVQHALNALQVVDPPLQEDEDHGSENPRGDRRLSKGGAHHVGR